MVGYILSLLIYFVDTDEVIHGVEWSLQRVVADGADETHKKHRARGSRAEKSKR